MTKRIISLVMALMLCICMTVPALAADQSACTAYGAVPVNVRCTDPTDRDGVVQFDWNEAKMHFSISKSAGNIVEDIVIYLHKEDGSIMDVYMDDEIPASWNNATECSFTLNLLNNVPPDMYYDTTYNCIAVITIDGELYSSAPAYFCINSPDTSQPLFSDVPSSAYYYDSVKWAVENGITNGTSTTTFSPNQNCTRAEIITFLWRAAGSPSVEHIYGTWDVTVDKYYFTAVQWAAEKDMIPHFENFYPNSPCTRLMAVDFMWKCAGSPKAPSAGFSDVSSSAVDWAVATGVTNGTSAQTFSPNSTCTRAEIATFLYRAWGL